MVMGFLIDPIILLRFVSFHRKVLWIYTITIMFRYRGLVKYRFEIFGLAFGNARLRQLLS